MPRVPGRQHHGGGLKESNDGRKCTVPGLDEVVGDSAAGVGERATRPGSSQAAAAVHEFLRRPLAEVRCLRLREWGVAGLIEHKSDRFRARACIVSRRRKPESRRIKESARRVIRSNDHPCENDWQCSAGGGNSEGHDERSWRSVSRSIQAAVHRARRRPCFDLGRPLARVVVDANPRIICW